MGRVKRIWYVPPMRAAKVQASLRIRAVSPEPPLLAHTSSESRGTFRQKARSLAPLNDWACAVKICHDGMLEDTNSFDGAQITQLQTNCAYHTQNSTLSEPPHDKIKKMTFAPSEDSLCTQWEAKAPSFLHVDKEDSDQTGWIPGLSESSLGAHAVLLVLSCGGSILGISVRGTICFMIFCSF